MNAQAALADGRLRVSGDVARLAAHAAALARLDDVFAAVRASTTYPGRRTAGRASGLSSGRRLASCRAAPTHVG